MSSSLATKYKLTLPTTLELSETVVVIDDHQDLRLILCHHFAKSGFTHVIKANNGFEAIEILKKLQKPPVILCNMTMPVLGGLELLAEMQEKPELLRGPFCLMMDEPSKEKVMLAFETGIDEALAKPFTIADVLPKLRSAFKKFNNPANPEKIYELAKVRFRGGDLATAKEIYRDLAQSAPTAARPHVGLARVALKEKNYDEALKHLDQAEKCNPNYVHLFSLRGSIFTEMQNLESAIANFTRAITLSPLNPIRYHDAVELLFKVNRYQEAVDILMLAEKHHLDFPGIHHFSSQGLFMLKDYKGAIKYIKRALVNGEDNVVYLNQLGICQKEAGDFEEAQKTYNKVIKLDPDNISALYNKSIMFHAKGSLEEAIKLLERLVKKHPDFAQALAKLNEYRKELQTKTGAA